MRPPGLLYSLCYIVCHCLNNAMSKNLDGKTFKLSNYTNNIVNFKT